MEPFYEYSFKEYEYPLMTIREGVTFSFPEHWHEEIEIIYVTRGSIDIVIRNNRYIIKEGCLVIIGRNDIHRINNTYDFNCCLIKFNMNMLQGLHHDTEQQLNLIKMLNHTLVIDEHSEDCCRLNVGRLIEEICDEFYNKEVAYKYTILSKLFELVATLLKSQDIKESVQTMGEKYKSHPHIEFIINYIEKNYDKELTLDIVSKKLNLNKNYFTRIFKQSTGMTFKKYLTARRLQKARQYLVETDYFITDISYLCGFASVKTFNRIFVDNMNCSPTEYRKCIFEKYNSINENNK